MIITNSKQLDELKDSEKLLVKEIYISQELNDIQTGKIFECINVESLTFFTTNEKISNYFNKFSNFQELCCYKIYHEKNIGKIIDDFFYCNNFIPNKCDFFLALNFPKNVSINNTNILICNLSNNNKIEENIKYLNVKKLNILNVENKYDIFNKIPIQIERLKITFNDNFIDDFFSFDWALPINLKELILTTTKSFPEEIFEQIKQTIKMPIYCKLKILLNTMCINDFLNQDSRLLYETI